MCQIDNSDPEYIKSSRNETAFFFLVTGLGFQFAKTQQSDDSKTWMGLQKPYWRVLIR